MRRWAGTAREAGQPKRVAQRVRNHTDPIGRINSASDQQTGTKAPPHVTHLPPPPMLFRVHALVLPRFGCVFATLSSASAPVQRLGALHEP
jgi:hypothetical protein